MTEYNALLIGLQIARKLGVKNLQAYGDSKLIVCQVRAEYKVKHKFLIPYHHAVIQIAEEFEHFYTGYSLGDTTHMQTRVSLACGLFGSIN